MRVSKKLVAINKLIERLEKCGFDLEMTHDHYRFYANHNPDLPCDAQTTISIYHPAFKAVFIGQANCSVLDQFDPAKGAQIAFNRAMHHMSRELGREEVKAIVGNQ